MKIKRCPLVLHHVISTQAVCKREEWHHVARDMRNAVIKNELYATGPIIFQASDVLDDRDEAIFRLYLPVNEPVDMPRNDKYSFHATWQLTC